MLWVEQMLLFERTIGEMRRILIEKGREYAGEQDALGNFKRTKYGMKPLQKLGTYLDKHMASIESYIESGQTFSEEPINGRIHDAMNYLFLMECLIEEPKIHPCSCYGNPGLGVGQFCSNCGGYTKETLNHYGIPMRDEVTGEISMEQRLVALRKSRVPKLSDKEVADHFTSQVFKPEEKPRAIRRIPTEDLDERALEDATAIRAATEFLESQTAEKRAELERKRRRGDGDNE